MKELKLKLGGDAVVTQLGTKVSKEDLYGDVRRIVEKEGRRLERGYLLPDGVLLRRTQMSNLSVDPEGTPVESPVVLLDDQQAEQTASSFDGETEVREVPLLRLAELNVIDVYDIAPGSLKPGLYETTFNYRKSYQPKDALILVKEGEAFLLVGQFKRSMFIGKNSTYEFFESEEQAEEADPLDFSMM